MNLSQRVYTRAKSIILLLFLNIVYWKNEQRWPYNNNGNKHMELCKMSNIKLANGRKGQQKSIHVILQMEIVLSTMQYYP